MERVFHALHGVIQPDRIFGLLLDAQAVVQQVCGESFFVSERLPIFHLKSLGGRRRWGHRVQHLVDVESEVLVYILLSLVGILLGVRLVRSVGPVGLQGLPAFERHP